MKAHRVASILPLKECFFENTFCSDYEGKIGHNFYHCSTSYFSDGPMHLKLAIMTANYLCSKQINALGKCKYHHIVIMKDRRYY